MIAALALIGIGISSYLTWYVLSIPPGSCPINEYPGLSCIGALSSSYSRIAGIPVAALGIFWFSVALVLAATIARNLNLLRYLLAWTGVGFVGIIVLVSVEVFLIGQLCLLCSLAHLLGVGMLGLTLKLWLSMRV